MWKVIPFEENIIIEDFSFNEEKEEGEEDDIVLPGDNEPENIYQIYEVRKTGDSVKEVFEGDKVALPHNAVEEFEMPEHGTVKFVHVDRVATRIIKDSSSSQ